jgi:N utilization substance protein B
MLYQADLAGDTAEQAIELFFDGELMRPDAAADDDAEAEEPPIDAAARRFAEHLVRGVRRRIDELDALIRAGSEHWRLERMAAVDRNVIRLALFELLDEPDTPAAVILDEAVELAKYYGGEVSGAFVNGVADGIRRRLAAGDLRRRP